MEEGAELIAACPLGLRGQATEDVGLTARFKRKDSVSVLITTDLKCTNLLTCCAETGSGLSQSLTGHLQEKGIRL